MKEGSWFSFFSPLSSNRRYCNHVIFFHHSPSPSLDNSFHFSSPFQFHFLLCHVFSILVQSQRSGAAALEGLTQPYKTFFCLFFTFSFPLLILLFPAHWACISSTIFLFLCRQVTTTTRTIPTTMEEGLVKDIRNNLVTHKMRVKINRRKYEEKIGNTRNVSIRKRVKETYWHEMNECEWVYYTNSKRWAVLNQNFWCCVISQGFH